MNKRNLMLGNEAIARGLIENGCKIATSYPGTPASEILSSLVAWKKGEDASMHAQWAVNEKVAFEIAYAGSITGLRTAVAMKQVGLNVASDPLMSAAYIGTKGGFIVISADDPGPHSSQTEQDSRLMAQAAKIPVLDPDSPSQARDMTALAFELSEEFEIPVMLRPVTRVCHARQDIELREPVDLEREACFEKDPGRWAATPKFRYHLHNELEKKLDRISNWKKTQPVQLNNATSASKVIVVSGVAAAHTRDILKDLGLWDKLPIYQVIQPFPLHRAFMQEMLERFDEILVVEETTGVIEMQFADRNRVRGRLSKHVPSTGELLPETIEGIIAKFAGIKNLVTEVESFPGRRPTLCAGCPHRASFYAIKKAAPKGIYTGDIGCYTLGMNLGAVDTVLCMGAGISQAAGFAHSYTDEKRPDILSTIGDSTFFHAGIPPLIDAVVQKVPMVLVILDNRTTAMTGSQPTPASGFGAGGEPLASVDIASIVKGCGVKFCKEEDPYHLNDLVALLKEAVTYSKENGPAVVIARHPCLLSMGPDDPKDHSVEIEITDSCDGCGYCVSHFECPALILDSESVQIDPVICTGCGVCLNVCPKGSIREKK